MANEFHDMLTEHLPRLRAYAIMLTRDPVAAEDLGRLVRALVAGLPDGETADD